MQASIYTVSANGAEISSSHIDLRENNINLVVGNNLYTFTIHFDGSICIVPDRHKCEVTTIDGQAIVKISTDKQYICADQRICKNCNLNNSCPGGYSGCFEANNM